MNYVLWMLAGIAHSLIAIASKEGQEKKGDLYFGIRTDPKNPLLGDIIVFNGQKNDEDDDDASVYSQVDPFELEKDLEASLSIKKQVSCPPPSLSLTPPRLLPSPSLSTPSNRVAKPSYDRTLSQPSHISHDERPKLRYRITTDERIPTYNEIHDLRPPQSFITTANRKKAKNTPSVSRTIHALISPPLHLTTSTATSTHNSSPKTPKTPRILPSPSKMI